MLDYAARRPAVATRGSSPNAMLAIIAVHVAALAALMSAKMDLPVPLLPVPTEITFIPVPKPPPAQAEARQATSPRPQSWSAPPEIIPTPPSGTEISGSSPSVPDTGALAGSGQAVLPLADLPRFVPPEAAQLLTAGSALRPPYPRSKLLSEEQAVLRLRLTIDPSGRVVAVTPAARADPAFLDAARRHILTHWRYRPARENGQAIVSSAVVTLHFRLDG